MVRIFCYPASKSFLFLINSRKPSFQVILLHNSNSKRTSQYSTFLCKFFFICKFAHLFTNPNFVFFLLSTLFKIKNKKFSHKRHTCPILIYIYPIFINHIQPIDESKILLQTFYDSANNAIFIHRSFPLYLNVNEIFFYKNNTIMHVLRMVFFQLY